MITSAETSRKARGFRFICRISRTCPWQPRQVPGTETCPKSVRPRVRLPFAPPDMSPGTPPSGASTGNCPGKPSGSWPPSLTAGHHTYPRAASPGAGERHHRAAARQNWSSGAAVDVNGARPRPLHAGAHHAVRRLEHGAQILVGHPRRARHARRAPPRATPPSRCLPIAGHYALARTRRRRSLLRGLSAKPFEHILPYQVGLLRRDVRPRAGAATPSSRPILNTDRSTPPRVAPRTLSQRPSPPRVEAGAARWPAPSSACDSQHPARPRSGAQMLGDRCLDRALEQRPLAVPRAA